MTTETTTYTPCIACWATREMVTPATRLSLLTGYAFCEAHAFSDDPLLPADGPTPEMLARAIDIPNTHPRARQADD